MSGVDTRPGVAGPGRRPRTARLQTTFMPCGGFGSETLV
jgi:hypothetical protein